MSTDIQQNFNRLNTEVANEPTAVGALAHTLAGISGMARDRGDSELASYIDANSGVLIQNAFKNTAYPESHVAAVDPKEFDKEREEEALGFGGLSPLPE